MATIQSQMVLVDRMSAPINGIISSMYSMIGVIKNVDSSMKGSFDTSKIQEVENQLQNATRSMGLLQNSIQQSENKQNQFNNEVKKGSEEMNGLVAKAKTMIGVYLGAQSIKKVFDLSDTLNQNTARLNLINDGLQTTSQLQKKIFKEAQASRGSYLAMADSVAKLRLQAKDAFTSNDQAIKFAGNLNKIFTISGTAVQGMESTMYNLTQALSSGVLRGQDFNVVMQNAPMLLEKVAESMNVPMGQLRELASKGVLSAQVVKDAILSASDDIDEKFQQMPMTWGQLWQQMSDKILIAFQPVLEMIGKGAQFINDNWSWLEPIFTTLAVAILFVASAVTAVGVAQWFLNSALMASGIGWIVIAIGMLIGLLVAWINHVGGVKVAWMIAMNVIKSCFDTVKIAIMTGVYALLNMFDKLILGVQKAAAGIANGFGFMKVKALTIIQNMVNGAIDLINKLISFVNKIPGVSISAIQHVTFAAKAGIQYEAEKQQRSYAIEQKENALNNRMQSRENALNKMKMDAEQRRISRLEEIQQARANKESSSALNYGGGGAGSISSGAGAGGSGGRGGSGGAGGKLGSDVSDIKDSVTKSEEDLKYLRDIAERDVINRFTTAEINLDMGGITQNINNNTDVDGVISYLENGLYEMMTTAAEGV